MVEIKIYVFVNGCLKIWGRIVIKEIEIWMRMNFYNRAGREILNVDVVLVKIYMKLLNRIVSFLWWSIEERIRNILMSRVEVRIIRM